MKSLLIAFIFLISMSFIFHMYAANEPVASKKQIESSNKTQNEPVIVGDVHFPPPPPNWKEEKPSSPMRKAEFKIKSNLKDKSDTNANEPPEVYFFYFGPNQGGTVDQNVERWVGQFDPKTVKHKIEKTQTQVVKIQSSNDSFPVTFVEAHGTFLSGMPGGPTTPKPNYALLGAIVEGYQGNVFVKMTGPAKRVEEASEDFRKMILSATPIREF